MRPETGSRRTAAPMSRRSMTDADLYVDELVSDARAEITARVRSARARSATEAALGRWPARRSSPPRAAGPARPRALARGRARRSSPSTRSPTASRSRSAPATPSPSQLVLVPMLLLAPPALVPLLVAAGVVVGRLPDILSGQHPSRLVFTLADAWHAAGPALVIALLAPGAPALRLWPVYLLALARAGRASTPAAAPLREWLPARGTTPRLHVRVFVYVFAVDAVLAPIGLLTGLSRRRRSRSPSPSCCPMIGLLGVFARERRGAHRPRAGALPRLPRHRDADERRPHRQRRLHRRRAQPRRRRAVARRRRPARHRRPRPSRTSSSPRCCTTSARSTSPTRSSTSPGASPTRSSRSSSATRPTASRCSSASAACWPTSA